MHLAIFFFVLQALAFPTLFHKRDTEVFVWDHSWPREYTIHKSCNATQTNQLKQALADTRALAQHAKDHVLRYGNLSEFYTRYFGNATTYEVIGVFEKLLSANKTGVLFRCDNIDGNCKFDGWAGHWRGNNGSDETVICDLSFTSRLYLSQMCSRGYTVAGSPTTVFWGGDLLHRLWHTDAMGEKVISHYADTYEDCLELAKSNASYTAINSATLRYYALDVYAYDISVPGVGCTGNYTKALTTSLQALRTTAAQKTSTLKSTTTLKSTSTLQKTTTEASVETSGKDCHVHADGEIHCV